IFVQVLPQLSVVGVVGEVVKLVAAGGDVGGAGVKRRRRDVADLGPLLGGLELGRGDVGPVGAAVGGEMHEAVVAAGPNQALLLGRFGDGKDDVVVLGAGVVLGDGAAGGLLLALVVAGEVGADDGPVIAHVGALKEHVAAVVNRLGVEGRGGDGGGPLEAVLHVHVTVTHGVVGIGTDGG